MKNKFIAFLMLIVCLFTLGGCGFVVEEESLMISSITTEVLEDGTTVVVITYANEDVKPTVFNIPKGKDGEIGNGILKVEYETSKDGKTTNVIMTMTNGEVKTIPMKNGVSIVSTRYEQDPEGNPYIVIVYSDDTVSERIPLQQGPAGKDGLSFVELKEEEITEGEFIGGKKLTFVFSDGTDDNIITYSVTIPAPEKGETGRGISAIVSGEDDENYFLTIEYSDGETETFSFAKPTISKWYNGHGTPSSNLGRVGDYYFDEIGKGIWVKDRADNQEIWRKVAQLRDESAIQFCVVTLNLNVIDDSAILIGDEEYYVRKGSNLALSSTKQLPIPTREGYVFGGWYTEQEVDERIHGRFTNLTTVDANVTIYAHWIPVEAAQ